jgi:pimeloyl-ACP methyl ester carboxylesterase
MAGSATAWAQVMPGLAQRFPVVAPDLLGHERATVLGQSLGGGVAMQFSYQYPERTERLVLVGCGGARPRDSVRDGTEDALSVPENRP